MRKENFTVQYHKFTVQVYKGTTTYLYRKISGEVDVRSTGKGRKSSMANIRNTKFRFYLKTI